MLPYFSTSVDGYARFKELYVTELRKLAPLNASDSAVPGGAKPDLLRRSLRDVPHTKLPEKM